MNFDNFTVLISSIVWYSDMRCESEFHIGRSCEEALHVLLHICRRSNRLCLLEMLKQSHISLPTDQRIPAKVIMHAYHASVELSEDEDTQNAPIVSASTIKTWIRILVKRSLLLEVIKGSVSLHGLFEVSVVFI